MGIRSCCITRYKELEGHGFNRAEPGPPTLRLQPLRATGAPQGLKPSGFGLLIGTPEPGLFMKLGDRSDSFFISSPGVHAWEQGIERILSAPFRGLPIGRAGKPPGGGLHAVLDSSTQA